MLFKRINRTLAETVFMVVKNVSGSTITAGYSCVFDVGSSVDGVRVTQASSTDLQAYAGVADADIADTAYVRIQVWGYRASAYIYSSVGTSAIGDNLNPKAAQWGLEPVTGAGAYKAFAFLCEAITASSSSSYKTTAKVFIRAL